eukprot:NODE_29598_length_441_cov_9.557325.p3 GENE.NODE_29598_length_441_cov_9.557325~~NODE_29598_length_441_cov_9.557325.p3  ORF type:complete len:74 (+),score=29.28 NODE_29598_length_441_cov_9.557325:216-437(+)
MLARTWSFMAGGCMHCLFSCIVGHVEKKKKKKKKKKISVEPVPYKKKKQQKTKKKIVFSSCLSISKKTKKIIN